MKGRVIAALFAVGAIIGAAGAIASSGGSPPDRTGERSSAKSQYCPPSSHQGGKRKKPGPAKCGKRTKARCVKNKRHKRKSAKRQQKRKHAKKQKCKRRRRR